MKDRYIYDHVRITPERQIGNHSDDLWELSYIITGYGTRTIGKGIPEDSHIIPATAQSTEGHSISSASDIVIPKDFHTIGNFQSMSASSPFEAGEVILIPPGISHYWAFNPLSADHNGNIENISVHISDTFLEHVSESFPGIADTILKFRSLTKAIRYTGHTRKQIIGLLDDMDGQDSIHKASSILLLIQMLTTWTETEIVGTSSSYDIPAIRFDKARIYISCNYSRKITLQEIASYVGMNRTAFCSFFKKHSGKSFITYLNEYRIEKACELLLNHKTSLSISEISSQTGFSEPAHFIRTFHRLKGCSPTRFTPK